MYSIYPKEKPKTAFCIGKSMMIAILLTIIENGESEFKFESAGQNCDVQQLYNFSPIHLH